MLSLSLKKIHRRSPQLPTFITDHPHLFFWRNCSISTPASSFFPSRRDFYCLRNLGYRGWVWAVPPLFALRQGMAACYVSCLFSLSFWLACMENWCIKIFSLSPKRKEKALCSFNSSKILVFELAIKKCEKGLVLISENLFSINSDPLAAADTGKSIIFLYHHLLLNVWLMRPAFPNPDSSSYPTNFKLFSREQRIKFQEVSQTKIDTREKNKSLTSIGWKFLSNFRLDRCPQFPRKCTEENTPLVSLLRPLKRREMIIFLFLFMRICVWETVVGCAVDLTQTSQKSILQTVQVHMTCFAGRYKIHSIYVANWGVWGVGGGRKGGEKQIICNDFPGKRKTMATVGYLFCAHVLEKIHLKIAGILFIAEKQFGGIFVVTIPRKWP